MPSSVTIQMKPEIDFKQALLTLPESNPLHYLGQVERVYLHDLGLRALQSQANTSQKQAVYMEHWDGVSPSVDISVILKGQAANLNRGRIRFRYTDEVTRSLEHGFLSKVVDAGLFIVEGYDCECDALNGIDVDQFVLRDGSRSFTGTIEGISPVISTHLATKQYVDTALGGGTLPPIYFNYNTPSPMILFTVDPGDTVDEIEMTITTPFDDPVASLQVGTVVQPSLIFSTADIDPTLDGQFRSAGNYVIPVAETIRLLIDPQGSTQGSGYILAKVRKA